MPVYQRKDIPEVIRKIDKGVVHPVYLIHGERYLCRRVGSRIIEALRGEKGGEQVHVKRIEGEEEDPRQTVHLLKSYSLFSGRQIIRIMDSRLLSSKINLRTIWERAVKAYGGNDREGAVRSLSRLLDLAALGSSQELAELSAEQWRKYLGFAKPGNLEWLNGILIHKDERSPSKTDGDQELISFLEEGRSRHNILVLISEEVDKRKKLYRTIDRQGIVVDLSVPAGESSAVRKEKDTVIRELISRTMGEMGKKPAPAVIENLIERVGFHPVAAVLETEKLALFCDDKDRIEVADINQVVGRTREEAIYELNEAVAELDLGRSLRLAERLRESGFYSLALVASLRNMLRKLLYLRFLQKQAGPQYIQGQSYGLFQKNYLTRLKSSPYGESVFLKGHPYAVYRSFQQAEKLGVSFLRRGLKELLRAEYRLKGSGVREDLIMDAFFFSFLTGQERD